MPTNDLHRACGYGQAPDWGRAGALLGLGEGADPHPDAKRLCAEKDGNWLPLHLALEKEAPEGVALALIGAHPQVLRQRDCAERRRREPPSRDA